jgi:2-polyprenyl-3-methyl-5-hydroxy-6-metoxy-1,4-benzoquinol methylase
MANELKGVDAHSAEYFGDTRDDWWNRDFFEGVAKRWRFDEVRRVLDVGCGVGHWSRTLAPVLSPGARLTGVDAESRWVEEATRRARAQGLGARFDYRVASAEAIPFEDAAFDLVTCQTLLIHVGDPARVLGEMKRLVRPGGIVMVAEPTNIHPKLLDSIALGDAPDTTASLLRFQLVCERGKRALGQGTTLLGESVPGLFVRAGLVDLDVRTNDRATWLAPPYDSPAQRHQVDEIVDMVERRVWIWDETTTRRFFLAGGGAESEFPLLWDAAMEQGAHTVAAIRAGQFVCAGGSLHYLFCARRPA